MVLHAAMCGNAYAFKNKVGSKIAELILLIPSRVQKIQLADYSIMYKVTGASGAIQDFPAEAIWHVRGPSWDGLLGMDVMNAAREALGLAIATEETHATLHAKGVRPSGTYSVDGTLDPAQYTALKAWITKEFAGSENQGAPMILDRGAKWLQQSLSGLDAQHLETRNFQIQEVCRFLDVMPIMVGHSDKAATYASAEQMFLAHVIHCLSPWYARIEQSADINLLTAKERAAGYYFKFIAAGLMRGASKDRSEYFAKALGSGGSPGWMTPDEVRALEELNPMGGKAAELPSPVTVQPSEPDPMPSASEDLQAAIKALEAKHFRAEEARAQDTRHAELLSAMKAMGASNQSPVHLDFGKAVVNMTNEAPAAPVVHVTNQVNPTPVDVQVTNQVAAPMVEVINNNNVTAQAGEVSLSTPPRRTESTVVRDASGNIVKTITVERDA